MGSVTNPHGATSTAPFLSAIMSLNVQRRDDALYLLARDYQRPLTPYDICKTQVLADVFQVVQTGKVVFGGKLDALPFGPVVKQTLDACERWAMGLLMANMLAAPIASEEYPLRPSGWTGMRNHIPQFEPSPDYSRRQAASWDMFSEQEHANVCRAYEHVVGMEWGESQRYFHEPVSAVGYAYDAAIRPLAKPFRSRVAMNWFDVLDGAEQLESADCSHARAMLGLWV